MTEYYKAYVKQPESDELLVLINGEFTLTAKSSGSNTTYDVVFSSGTVLVKSVRGGTTDTSLSAKQAISNMTDRVLAAVLGNSDGIDKEVIIKALVSLREAQDVYDKESVQSDS